MFIAHRRAKVLCVMGWTPQGIIAGGNHHHKAISYCRRGCHKPYKIKAKSARLFCQLNTCILRLLTFCGFLVRDFRVQEIGIFFALARERERKVTKNLATICCLSTRARSKENVLARSKAASKVDVVKKTQKLGQDRWSLAVLLCHRDT